MTKRLKFFHQHESIDCGPACLAMIGYYHGLPYTVGDIKKLCAITRMGVSIQDIVQGGKKMGLAVTPLKLTVDELKEIPLPAILFWKQDHFVVLHKIKSNVAGTLYHIADPGYGKAILETDVFLKEWIGNNQKGVAIVAQSDELIVPQVKSAIHGAKPQSPIIGLLKRFFGKRKAAYSASILLLLVAFGANCAMPYLFQRIIDDGIGHKSFHLVWILLLAQLGLFLGNFFSTTVSNWILSKTNFALSILLKKDLLKKLMRLPISYFDTRLNTDTLQRIGDQSKVQNFLTWKGLELTLSVLSVVTFSIILFLQNRNIFLIYFVFSALSVIWVVYFLNRRKTMDYALFLRQSEISNHTYEFIMHMPEIKVNGAQEKLIDKLISLREKQNRVELRTIYLNILQTSGVSFLIRLKDIIAIALCAYLIINGQMTIGYLMSITYILGQLSGPTQNFIYFLRDAQEAQIANRRINDIYFENDENAGDHLPLPTVIKDISFDRVSFKYPGSFNPFVLNDISILIPENKVTAIIGQSGSGKSTLLKLLLSYYTPNDGRIMITDYNLKDLDTDQWRKECGIVMQDGNIFNGTIIDNIALSDKDPDMDRIKNAAAIACIQEFIESLPMGFNTKVGNVGSNRSCCL
jgi:ATP-binding cassette, subfamily B, bacterial